MPSDLDQSFIKVSQLKKELSWIGMREVIGLGQRRERERERAGEPRIWDTVKM